ncbi:PspC domain-containing protein [Chloroflexota bacterium]
MSENVKKLYRSTSDRMIAGICGGLGDYFGIDSTLVRLIFVIGAIFTGSALFWAYIIMLIVVPEAPVASQSMVEAHYEEPAEEKPTDEPIEE